jgi:predicted dehydrogenase
LPKSFSDYREMFDKMQGQIDAVFVATPDHHHATASMTAIRLGKHVYCEKPLTHNIREARLLTLAAREHKVATQLGNNGREGEGWRRLCEWIWAGAIGSVQEAHIWTDRAGIPKHFWWPQGGNRPAGADPTPAGLNWDAWLGPAPERPYQSKYKEGKFQGKSVYQPFVWRGWWDFGTGALGDIGCHAISMPFMGLDLRDPVSVEPHTSGNNQEMFPEWSIVTYEFAATASRPAVKLVWYDGGKTPPQEICGEQKPGGGGSLVIGEKGVLWGNEKLIGVEPQDVQFPESPGHFEEWVRAIQGGEPAMANFPNYAGPLAETVLLGNLAVWGGQRVEWDAEHMKAKNAPGLDRLIKPEYRKGYTLE